MHDLSYASGAQTRAGRALIKVMEGLSGRGRLLRRAEGYGPQVAAGTPFFDVMAARYGLSLNIVHGALGNIPREGPLIVVANHPFGILDGLMMGHILQQRRADFRILANAVFAQAPELEDMLLPIDFSATKHAVSRNLNARQNALATLREGGAIGVFPGGTVSTGAGPFARPVDPEWRNFTARMIARSEAVVVPVYFHGQTSRMFQIASHLHMTLRLGLLVHEFARRADKPVDVSIGAPLCDAALRPYGSDPKQMMDFLRKATYETGAEPLSTFETGYDFEDRQRR